MSPTWRTHNLHAYTVLTTFKLILKSFAAWGWILHLCTATACNGSLNAVKTNFPFTMNGTTGMRQRRPQVIRFAEWENDIKLWSLVLLKASPGSSLAKHQGSPLKPSCLWTLLVLSHRVPRLCSCLQFPTVICTPAIWHLLGKLSQYFCKDLRDYDSS